MKRLKLIKKLKLTKKFIGYIIMIGFVAFFFCLPTISGTKTYPLSIVDGSSMDPTLAYGDLVYYKATNTLNIPNGTVIVFTTSSSTSLFATATVIHRIVAVVPQPDGTVYYKTKGDNNAIADLALVKPSQILGVQAVVIPKIGYLFLFFRSAQGLVVFISIILIVFMLSLTSKSNLAKQKDALIGELALKNVNGDFSNEIFQKFYIAINYFDHLDTRSLNDEHVMAIADWIKKGALEKGWRIQIIKCFNCQSSAVIIESAKTGPLIICTNSSHRKLDDPTSSFCLKPPDNFAS